ncbi:MAG: hypothetical protein U0640_06140 [Phycisphaerales bacterium]
MNRSTAACVIACAGLSGVALAQNEEYPITSGTVMYIPPDVPPVFAGRSVVRVWGTNASDFRGYSTSVPPARAANDFDFAGGPAANIVGSVQLAQAYFAVVFMSNSTIVSADVRVSVYSTFSGWIDGAFPGGNLVGQCIYHVGPCDTPTCIEIGECSLSGALVPNVAGADGLFMIEVFLPGTTTLHPTAWTPATRGTALDVGSSDPQRWGDVSGPDGVGGPDGLVQPLNGGTVWEVNSASIAGGRAIYGGLWADIPAPLACDSIDFNNDTLFDPQDIDAFLSIYSEGPCVPATATCNDVDFNNDGSIFDPCDIDSFLLVFSEGPCTLCGL